MIKHTSLKITKFILPFVIIITAILGVSSLFINVTLKTISIQNTKNLENASKGKLAGVDKNISENLKTMTAFTSLYEESLQSPEPNFDFLKTMEDTGTFSYVRYADMDGVLYDANGNTSNCTGRPYFTDGTAGGAGIVVIPHSRINNQTVICFYAPVHYENNIVGVLLSFHDQFYLTQILNTELFNNTAETILCSRDGTVIGSSTSFELSNNFFTFDGETDKFSIHSSELEKMQEAIQNATYLVFNVDGKLTNSEGIVYPMDGADWVCVQIFPPEAAHMLQQRYTKIGSGLMFALVTVFFIAFCCLIRDNKKSRQQLEKENRNANYIMQGSQLAFDKYILLDIQDRSYEYLNTPPAEDVLPAKGNYDYLFDYFRDLIVDENEKEEFTNAFSMLPMCKKLEESNGSFSYTFHMRADEDCWDCLNVVTMEKEQSEIHKVLIATQRVTELKKREESHQAELKEALIQAESASRAKTAFLFNMSHDIRTPMSAIIGYASLAASNTEIPDIIKGYLSKIQLASAQLLALINDVLDMSHIENENFSLRESECNLENLLSEILVIVQPQIADRHLNFSMDYKNLRNKDVICDRIRLKQIILNILTNSIKFTPAAGHVQLWIEQEDSSPDSAFSTYRIFIKDTGIGMSEDFTEKIYEPFERERTSTISGAQGTGLGMCITKRIVDMMNGSIEFVTAPNQGTEFCIRLSFKNVNKTLSSSKDTVQAFYENPSPDDAPNFAGKRILLVEDNTLNREVANDILQRYSFKVDFAEDGSICVNKIQTSQPGYYDLVLMDIQMPVMDGYNATRAIRRLKNPQLSSIPIIALTANAFDEDRQAAFNSGMNGHLAKPLDVTELFSILKTVL